MLSTEKTETGERWGAGRGEERGAGCPEGKEGAEAEGPLERRVHTEMGGLGSASCPGLSPKVTLSGGEESV